MGMRGGSAKSCFGFEMAACTGSSLGFVLAHSPAPAWPGAQTKAEPGAGTTLRRERGS